MRYKRILAISRAGGLPNIRAYSRQFAPDIRAIAGIVKAGVGYSVLPDYLCRDDINNGELTRLGPPGPENMIYLVWRKGALKHPRVSYAKDILMAFANINKYSAS